MTITPEELAAWKKLCVLEPEPFWSIKNIYNKDLLSEEQLNEKLISAARIALPRLIEEIERLTIGRKLSNHYNKKKYLDIKNKRYDAVLCMRDNMGMKFAAIGVEIGRTEARAAAIYKEAKKRGTK